MKRYLIGFLTLAILVAFTAPSFAGVEKRKEDSKLIEQLYADDKKKDEKKDEKKGGEKEKKKDEQKPKSK